MPGSMMSISTTSGGVAWNSSIASSPLLGLVDRPALVLEGELDRRADALVVLDGQDACTHAPHDARSAGIRRTWPLQRLDAAASSRSTSSAWTPGAAASMLGRVGRTAVEVARDRHPASRAISSPAASPTG